MIARAEANPPMKLTGAARPQLIGNTLGRRENYAAQPC